MLIAKEFRQAINSLEGLKHYRFSPDANDLYEHLESEYEKAKNRISALFDSGESQSIIKSHKNGLFIISVGLFAYGRLDVAEDILNNIPGGRGSINHLAGVLKRLLPLPSGYSPRDNPNAIKEWLRVKRSRLRWDELAERYILENFRVLWNLPLQANCQHFNVQEQHRPHEKLILEILPDDGTNWYASFQSGCSEFSGVYQHPNRVDLIIISNGQGYIVNPENQQLLEIFGGEITEAIEFIDSYAILFQDPSGFICYDETGFLWHNQEFPSISIRQLYVKRILLMGECQRSTNTDWEPFWLNVKTGEVRLEKYDPVRDFRQSMEREKRPWWKLW